MLYPPLKLSENCLRETGIKGGLCNAQVILQSPLP
nr:MAG TPA: hypothetical protein [Caudoviricetes sp.]